MAKVVIISLFRDNSQEYVERYYHRLSRLAPDHEVISVVVEGDSVNQTWEYLREGTTTAHVVQTWTGIRHYGSVVSEERFKCLSLTANTGLDHAATIPGLDYVAFIDSDLIYGPDLLTRLIGHGKEVIAPLIMAADAFYDIWGFRKLDGDNFSPFTRDLPDKENTFEVSSAGGVVLFKAQALYDGVRFGMGAIVSLCHNLRAYGYSIWVDPKTVVYHPVGGGPLTYEGNLMRWPLPSD